ncbi:HNH endonuclease [Coleofasciculus chthonoplastes]|uniref:HNH endonuclease n=1 Tax=Coleofasciculus chthonoplastes TaxID=64178 RepID=UPI0032FD18D8
MTSVTKGLRCSVVVFSKNYLPLSRVNMKRAVTLLVTGKAEPLDWCKSQGYPVHSPSLVLLVPEQIRLTKANSDRVWKVPPVNRREVLRRDKHRCQYCGSPKRLTLDHVIPRSKGGNHRWDNVVTACQRCNSQKGDRTPEQAGMTLLTQPKAPMHPTVAFAEQFWREQHVHLE